MVLVRTTRTTRRSSDLCVVLVLVGALLDEEIGYLLEYCHLFKHSNHKKVWDGAFGKEVG